MKKRKQAKAKSLLLKKTPSKGQRRTKDPYRQPTIQHFEGLEKQIKQKKGLDKEDLRVKALEFLRLEALKRAFPDIDDTILDQFSNQSYRPDPIKELLMVRGGDHLWLIGLEPHRRVSTIFPFRTPAIKKSFSVLTLNPGETESDPRRLLLSIDPLQPKDKLLYPAIDKAIDRKKNEMKRKRAPGAGAHYKLDRLWEALIAYDLCITKKAISQKEFGMRAKTFPKLEEELDYKQANDRGHDLITLAKKMVKIAKNDSVDWLSTFY